MATTATDRPFPSPARVLAVAGVVFVLLAARAVNRDFDPDEHQFLAPALLAAQGLRPYVDFPMFHMPGLVPVYRVVTAFGDNALLAVRLFSAALGTLDAVLVLSAACTWLTGFAPAVRWRFGLALVAVMLSARVFTYTNGLAWNHDPSIAPLLAAALLFLHALRTGRITLALPVGLLIGLSISIRLSTAPALAAFGLGALILPAAATWRARLGACVLAGLGAAAALAPSAFAFARAPDRFVFGNLTYPAIYREYVLAHTTAQTSLLAKAGHFFQTWFTDPGNAVIAGFFLLAIFRVIVTRAWRSDARPAFLLMLLGTLWIGVIAPFQIQYQYHSVLLPFFLLFIAAAAAHDAGRTLADRRWVTVLPWVALVAVAINFPRWYWSVIRLPTPDRWETSRIDNGSRWLRAALPAEARVLTIDPILPLQAGLRVYPAFATGRFTFHIGPYTTDAQRDLAGLLWGPQLERAIDAEPPAAVFYWTKFEPLEFVAIARHLNFERRTSPDGAFTLWVPAGKE